MSIMDAYLQALAGSHMLEKVTAKCRLHGKSQVGGREERFLILNDIRMPKF